MASNTSKTARASVRAGQAGQGGALSVLGEFKYLIPLNNGKHAYVRNLTNGKTAAPAHRLRGFRRGGPGARGRRPRDEDPGRDQRARRRLPG